MSYSYAEVLPYLFATSWADDLRCIFNPDLGLFDKETYDQEYDYYIEESYSEYALEITEVKIPAFKGTHYATGEEREFEAKIFHISTKFKKNELHDSSDGKTTYSEFYELTDTKTKEKFKLEFYYYSSDYPHLTSITITPIEAKEKKPKKIKTQFVIVEQVPQYYIIHGIFSALDNAVKGMVILKENKSFLSKNSQHIIEEVPQNTPFVYNPDNENSYFLHGAIKQYDSEGNTIS